MKETNVYKKIGFCICGSFCTIKKTIEQMKELKKLGHEILPVMSFTACSKDTRFGKAKEITQQIENICNKKIVKTIEEAEPIGPKQLTDILVIAPCTGNTLAKIEKAITDTPVTMAIKSHLRVQKNVLIALATNDALAGTAKNLGSMLNRKHFYFVPMIQDDVKNKPYSLVSDFNLIPEALEKAYKNIQLRPIFLTKENKKIQKINKKSTTSK